MFKAWNFKYLKNPFAAKLAEPNCQKLENTEAVFEKSTYRRELQPIQIPITREVTETIVLKEASQRQIVKCGTDGTAYLCTEQTPAETETITYQIVTGYRTVQEGSVIERTVETLACDGQVVMGGVAEFPG